VARLCGHACIFIAAREQRNDTGRQNLVHYPADMKQDNHSSGRADRPWAPLVRQLQPDQEALARAVARDVAAGTGGSEDPTGAADAVAWLLDVLAKGPVPDDAALRSIRIAAAADARAGRPLRPALDRTLSAGWVVWGSASRLPGADAGALAALGDALLRTGDAAAAAIADGHATAEREAVTRSVSARRELLDEILELRDDDPDGRARLFRRAVDLAIPVDRKVDVVVVLAQHDLEDEDPDVLAVARALARGGPPAIGDPRGLGGLQPTPVVATSRGHLVVLVPAGPVPPDLVQALAPLGAGCTTVVAAAPGLAGIATAARDATAAAVVASRVGRTGAVLPVEALLLERALLAEPALLRAAVDRELGALERAPRAAALVATLEAYLSERENVRAAARRLGVAPRTVAYRLERIGRILGGPLDPARRLRLAAALFARTLLAPEPRQPDRGG